MDEWLEWNLKGSFRVHIPADARTRLDDDQTTAVIQLGTGEDITEVLLSNFPLKKPTQDRTELAVELRDHAIGFFNHAVAKAVGHAVPINVEVTEEPDQKLYYAQGVAVIDREKNLMWLLRNYARRGENRFWLMHWNGPKENLETILRIFVSFEPDESSFC